MSPIRVTSTVDARVPEMELADVQPGQRAVVRHGSRLIPAARCPGVRSRLAASGRIGRSAGPEA